MTVFANEKYYPYAAALEVTLKCNMRCLHCGSSATNKDRDRPLEFSEWCRVIDELSVLGTKAITLSGGEPFCYPRWRDVVRYAVETAPDTRICIISNGTVCREDDIVFLKKTGLHFLSISLDGNEEIHDLIRRRKGSFRRILTTVGFCRRHELSVNLVTSVNRLNFGILEEIRRIVEDLGIDIWQVQIINSFGRAGRSRESLLINEGQYARLIEMLHAWKKTKDAKPQICVADSIGYCHPKTRFLFDGADWLGCSAGKYIIGIEASGDVKGCLSLQDRSFTAGNIRERALEEIWKDDDAFWYTRKYDPDRIEGECAGCAKRKECRCGCLGTGYSFHRTIYRAAYCYRAIRSRIGSSPRPARHQQFQSR